MARASEIVELTRTRVLLFLREPEILFWVFAFPVVLAAILGFAFRRGSPQPSRIAVVAPDGSSLAARMSEAERIEVVPTEASSADRDLRRGRVDLVLREGEPPQLRYDPTRPEGELARLRVERALAPPEARLAETSLAVDHVDERGSRYLDFLFPGLLGTNLMSTGMWSLGFAVAEMRQKKLLRRLLVTPMRKTSFLSSLLLARFVFLLLEVVALLLFGVLVLGVPFRGSVVDFAVLCTVAGLSFATIGILVVARARTVQGASGMLNLAMVPMWLGSGIFFSYERFPEALHPFLKALPLTGLNDALRAVMLDGTRLAALLPEIAIQVAWLAVSAWLGLKLFRWE
jgi:ABC-type multidrug transport system permease subunit